MRNDIESLQKPSSFRVHSDEITNEKSKNRIYWSAVKCSVCSSNNPPSEVHSLVNIIAFETHSLSLRNVISFWEMSFRILRRRKFALNGKRVKMVTMSARELHLMKMTWIILSDVIRAAHCCSVYVTDKKLKVCVDIRFWAWEKPNLFYFTLFAYDAIFSHIRACFMSCHFWFPL